jgi:hypothetical protein
VKGRNLLDSLYRGFPVGYLIAWRNPTVKLKDGTPSAGKRILIDGQQRVTALMAALLGREVLTDDYETVRIRIAFNPQEEKFEVASAPIRSDASWISDIAEVFSPDADLIELTEKYTENNLLADRRTVGKALQKLAKIVNNHVGIIELSDDLDIETVTEIFIRVNSAGMPLSQADFAMSKIAVNKSFGGDLLRKAIDYFCHLSVAPEFLGKIEKGDRSFADSEFFQKMRWLKDVNDDIYDPTYTDMLRVAFTSEFRRGKLQDLVALLSGRNFETKQYEESIAESSFAALKRGVEAFISQTHFERLTMILRSAGFVCSDLIGGRNAVNFAYIIYLRGRAERLPPAEIERLVRRWYAMSVLTGRYGSNPETMFDQDIRQIDARGLSSYIETILSTELPESFWSGMLPQVMDTSSVKSPYFLAYQAAQVKMGDRGFLSRDITVQDLLLNRCDVHHLFPKKHLKSRGVPRNKYNQIANFAIAQSEINIAIGEKPPEVYFAEMLEQCSGGKAKYGGIMTEEELRANLKMHSIPEAVLTGGSMQYEDFLEERRRLMSQKMKEWFSLL